MDHVTEVNYIKIRLFIGHFSFGSIIMKITDQKHHIIVLNSFKRIFHKSQITFEKLIQALNTFSYLNNPFDFCVPFKIKGAWKRPIFANLAARKLKGARNRNQSGHVKKSL